MHIALLSAEFPPMPGGIGDYTAQLGRSLALRGHQVSVFTIHESRFLVFTLEPEPRLEQQFPATGWGWRSWPAVIAALHVTRPDVLHVQYQTGAYSMHPAINFLPKRLQGLPGRPALVVTAHDLLEPYLFPKAGPLRTFVTRRLLADADAAIVTNEHDLAALANWPEVARHTTLIPIGSNIALDPPPGYAREVWRQQLGATAETVLVGYFGLLGQSKGVDTLVEALANLPPNVRLLLIGGEATQPHDRAHAEQVRQRIAALGLGERVFTTGQVGEREVSGHLLACDMVALPYADGATFRRGSLLAALAHGCPVITTQAAQPAPLRDGEEALLVPPADPAALAAAIQRLAGDTALRTRLGEAGRQRAAAFGWPAIATQHEALYGLLA